MTDAVLTPDLAARLGRMEGAMQRLRAEAVEKTASMNLSAILKPYGYRAGLWLVVSAALAALLYLRVRRIGWWRAALNGFFAAGSYCKYQFVVFSARESLPDAGSREDGQSAIQFRTASGLLAKPVQVEGETVAQVHAGGRFELR